MTTTTPMTAVHHSELAGLPSLARRFMTWRCTRPRGQRIPRELWPAATALARIHGISPTVAALKLNYYDRQRRLHSGQACRRGRPPAAVFVEVPSVPSSSGGGERGMVELIHPGGARLIVHRGSAGVDELLAVGGTVSTTPRMIQITPQMRILVAVEPVDFRKGIDGLAALCRQVLASDPLGGALFRSNLISQCPSNPATTQNAVHRGTPEACALSNGSRP